MNESQTNAPAEQIHKKPGEAKFALLEARLLFLVALVALAVRFLISPWDFGGCFFQVWMTLVGTAGFTMLLAQLKTRQRILASCVLVPCLVICFFGPIFFPPQIFFPFFFLGAAVWGIFRLGSLSRFPLALLVSLTLIPISVFCMSGINHMVHLIQFRELKGSDLREIKFEAIEGSKTNIVISDPAMVARIARAIHATWPYSPNHEGIPTSWLVLIYGKDGTLTSCQIGKGNRAHPKFASVHFDSDIYQNPELPGVLHQADSALDLDK